MLSVNCPREKGERERERERESLGSHVEKTHETCYRKPFYSAAAEVDDTDMGNNSCKPPALSDKPNRRNN